MARRLRFDVYTCTGKPAACVVPSWEWGDVPCRCDADANEGICCGGFGSGSCPSTIVDGALCCGGSACRNGDRAESETCTCTPTDNGFARWRCSAPDLGGAELPDLASVD